MPLAPIPNLEFPTEEQDLFTTGQATEQSGLLDANALETERSKRSPFAKFTFVDVTFGTANTDYIITHKLETPDPEVIRWWAIKNDTAGVVYRDAGTPPRVWGEGYVVLKCSVANANVRLLLFVEQI